MPCRASSRLAMVSTTVGCFIQRPPSDAHSVDQMVPRVGFEPTTYRLRSGCSTAELPGQRPVGDRGAYRDEVLASHPIIAKPIRDRLTRSLSARLATPLAT